MAGIPMLSPDVKLIYLAEGAANVVYRLQTPTGDHSSIKANTADLHTLTPADNVSTPPPSEIEIDNSPTDSLNLDGKLLRVHKDVSWIPSYYELYHSYQTLIALHFAPEEVITQTLVRLPLETITACNDALYTSESSGLRPSARAGVYVSTTDLFGLVIEDMSAQPGESEVLIEIKPKWLAQSPNAPRDSRRCRTCALRASRRMKKGGVEGVFEKSALCPMDLLAEAGGSEHLEAYVRSLLLQQGDTFASSVDNLTKELSAQVHRSPILRRLRDLQRSLDPHGVLGIKDDKPSDDFLVATTLRDCTMFVKAKIRAGNVEAVFKLGDLDLKQAGTGKLEYWRGLEKDLINGAFYQGGDGVDMGCLLERV